MLFTFWRKKNTANGVIIAGSTMAAWVSTRPRSLINRNRGTISD